jgi:hypothetical protein
METVEKRKEQLLEDYIKEAYGEDPYYILNTQIICSKKDFNAGFSAKEKIIKDKLNHYKSQLKELTSAKLDKRVNQDKVRELEIRIETLQDLI